MKDPHEDGNACRSFDRQLNIMKINQLHDVRPKLRQVVKAG